MSKTVLVVEDDPGTAKGLAYSISGTASLSLVAVVHNVAAAKKFLAANKVDVCLVDLGLPDGSGLEVIKYAAEQPEPAHILVCTVFGDEKSVISSIEAGASGYILKDALTTSVGKDIETLLNGGSALSPMIAKILLTRLRAPAPVATPAPASPNASALPDWEKVQLSPREHEVLSLIARGCTYQEVGVALSISVETVSAHLRNTYKKLSVHSRSEAVYEAGRLGILKVN
jgi:DNA-binding NarL/FixJ family response regulator